MKSTFAKPYLRCPSCGAEDALDLQAEAEDQAEIRSGTLICERCHSRFTVERGVADLLPESKTADYVRAEADGLERFAELMRNDGWTRERILELPYAQDGYWYVQAVALQQLLDTVELKPGQTILDVGSNTCWAASQFAERGLKAIALDIATVEYQGLYTADFFFDAGRNHFERVLATMNDIPIASSSLDYVFCCQVLHHNDLAELQKAMHEFFRILKPGGKLLVINETLKRVTDPSGVHIEGVEEFEGNEHAHWAWQYRWVAHRAGFRKARTLLPIYHPILQEHEVHLPIGTSSKQALRTAASYAMRHNRYSRRAIAEWLLTVKGPAQFSMVTTKPADAA
ncbi:MAG: methyltransferase domain-containing protein [Solirubrobacterales bacterium]|nr:methyltransferase domain-containing protein [Solirubrobacterales bacterium]